jgi:hypothetical protein
VLSPRGSSEKPGIAWSRRSALAPAVTVGYWSRRTSSKIDRAWSTRVRAIRTSWLASSARVTSASSTGSSNCAHQRGSKGCSTTSDGSTFRSAADDTSGVAYGLRAAHDAANSAATINTRMRVMTIP